MRQVIVFVAALAMSVGVVGSARASLMAYSIVDYPANQVDMNTGFTDSVSGTIMADPDTGVISSASFTITGQTGSITVLNAIIDNPYFAFVTPSQIYLTWNNPSNAYEYGYLGFRNRTDGGYPNAVLSWYLLGEHDALNWPTLHYSAYMGQYKTGKTSVIADFGTPLGASPWVIANAVPEPASMTLLAIAAGGLVSRRRRAG